LFTTLADPKTKADLWVLPVAESKSDSKQENKAFPFVNAAYSETAGVFSPDMKWIAYTSDATGRTEIYVRPFASSGAAAAGQWQLSKDGGRYPHWSADGKEIFFSSLTSLMTVVVNTTAGFSFGTAQPLFRKPQGPNEAWDVTADGKKFLITTAGEAAADGTPTAITVVLNWPTMLKK
jgi:serine/threonine-protein kinase